MRFKLDENLSRYLKPVLEALNHKVSTAAEESLLSKPDAIIAAAAKKENRILLTLDVEFADLRKYPPGDNPGIIVFRPESFGPLAVNKLIETFVKTVNLDELKGCLVIVEPTRVRIRRPSEE
jgi:predicted nuclease of predicted toxin-antitoxin system